MKTSDTTNGILIGVLVFLLLVSTIVIFWEAQVIAKQEAVIHLLIEGRKQ